MNSDECERVKQIREDRTIWAGMGKVAEYLDFLLSLYDQLGSENERLNAIVSAYENQNEEALAKAENL